MPWILARTARPILAIWAGAMIGIVLTLAQELGPSLLRFIASPSAKLGTFPLMAEIVFLYACEYAAGIALICAALWLALKGLHRQSPAAAMGMGFVITFGAWIALNLLGEDPAMLVVHGARLGLAGAAAGWVTWRTGRVRAPEPPGLQPALTHP